LAEETTLSEQCIQGEGAVQVNLELKSVQNVDRINILDVLKPQDEDLPSVSDDNTTSVVETDTIITDNVVKLEECLTNETVSCASPVLEEVELPLPDSLTSTENDALLISHQIIILFYSIYLFFFCIIRRPCFVDSGSCSTLDSMGYQSI